MIFAWLAYSLIVVDDPTELIDFKEYCDSIRKPMPPINSPSALAVA